MEPERPVLSPVFERNGSAFVPMLCAQGPWNPKHLHGGPVLGLFAHVLGEAASDPELRLCRFVTDLHTPVPAVPLLTRVAVVRSSRRLLLLHATLHAEDKEVARASGLYLRTREPAQTSLNAEKPPGPDGLISEPLFRGLDPKLIPPGFHTHVHTRFVPREQHTPLAIWFHLPMPLIDGVATSPLVAASALADFAAAAASLESAARGQARTPYINADSTQYFARPPEGEWFCLVADRQAEQAGLNVIEVSHYDVAGCFGRSMQARIAL